MTAQARSQISKKHILRDGLTSIATMAIQVTVLVWVNGYLLRKLPPGEYSIYPVIASFMAVIPMLMTILTSGLGRYIAEAHAQGRNDRITAFTSTAFVISLLAAGGFMALAVLASRFVTVFIDIAPEMISDARWMAIIMAANMALIIVTSPFKTGFFATQRLTYSSLLNLAQHALRAGLMLAFLLVLGPRVLWVPLASLVAVVLANIPWIALSKKLLPAQRFRLAAFDKSIIRELVSFGSWNFLGDLSNRLRMMADPIILNHLATPVDVNSFHVGNMIAQQPVVLWANVSRTLMPSLVKFHAADEHERIKNAYFRGGRLAMWSAFILAVPLMVFHRELIVLYIGNTYIKAGTVLLLLWLAQPIARVNAMLPPIMNAKGTPKPLAIRILIFQVANVLVTLVLVGWFSLGAVGSGLGTFLTALLVGIPLNFTLAKRVVNYSWKELFVEAFVPGLIPAAVTAGALIATKLFLPVDTWPRLLLLSAGAACFYFVVLVFFCLKPPEKADLKSVLDKIRHRAQ
jgi:O-antigen/teichoic acid export membrane protein